MAETEEELATKTDIYMQQKKTIDTLVDVLKQQQQPQTVYVQPYEEKEQKTPNYLLYIGIGVVVLFLLLKK